MKNYNKAKLAYNLALYSLTSIITCFFFSSPFWFPSITNHFSISSFSNIISSCLNAKCLFLLGNIIVFILVGESKLKQSPSSPTKDIYDEYVARSRSNYHKATVDADKKLEMKIKSMHGGEEIGKGTRSYKSPVWGENGKVIKIEKTKSKKEEQILEGEKMKVGMLRSSKSAVWSESETNKMEKGKGKKEEQCRKSGEEKKMELRSSKSAVWSVEMERGKGKKEEKWSKNIIHEEEKIKGMRGSRSAVWGENEKQCEEIKKEEHEEEMKMGMMRSCRSEIWSKSDIRRLGKKQEEEQQLNVLNKRVEDFIARVNKQRLLEAKTVDHSKG